jgi:hypothetical protein
MNRSAVAIAAALALPLLVACDRQIPQTVIVRANIENPALDSLWLAQTNECTGQPIKPGWYRDGLWIFRLSTTRGGVSAVTQELTLCVNGAAAAPTKAWHSLHGGGAPLLVLSCVRDEREPCRMYQDGYTEGAWSSDGE